MSEILKFQVVKDLPWLKAGTIIWIDKNGFLCREIDDKDGMPESIGGTIILGAEPYRATLSYFSNNLNDKEWFRRI